MASISNDGTRHAKLCQKGGNRPNSDAHMKMWEGIHCQQVAISTHLYKNLLFFSLPLTATKLSAAATQQLSRSNSANDNSDRELKRAGSSLLIFNFDWTWMSKGKTRQDEQPDQGGGNLGVGRKSREPRNSVRYCSSYPSASWEGGDSKTGVVAQYQLDSPCLASDSTEAGTAYNVVGASSGDAG